MVLAMPSTLITRLRLYAPDIKLQRFQVSDDLMKFLRNL
jgi:hypothetical protein